MKKSSFLKFKNRNESINRYSPDIQCLMSESYHIRFGTTGNIENIPYKKLYFISPKNCQHFLQKVKKIIKLMRHF